MNKSAEKNNRVRVGISHGDINGINYELFIKSFSDLRILELYTPVVYGSSRVASFHRKALNINDFSFNIISSAQQLNPKRPNLVNCCVKDITIELGKSSEEAGRMAFEALEKAVEGLKKNEIDVLVTGPINKSNIQSKDFNFPGHTEYLAERFQSPNHLMLMISENLRLGVVTGHIPISEVPSALSQELILNKTKLLNESLKVDFGIRKPKIAILGLNPHAGDDGLLGKEENEIIVPAVKQAFDENILAFGPYPADGFFGSQAYRKFDGVLAMFHDQGLAPFKALSFDSGVNFTAGLPIVRTSPAHGTAYDIAGKNIASTESLNSAIYLAIEIFNNRKLNKEISANPLQYSEAEQRNNNHSSDDS